VQWPEQGQFFVERDATVYVGSAIMD
jgi:hypothetical protein